MFLLCVRPLLPPQKRCTCGLRLDLPHLLLNCALHPAPLLAQLRLACATVAHLPLFVARMTAKQLAALTGPLRTKLVTTAYQPSTRPLLTYHHTPPPRSPQQVEVRFDASKQGERAGIGVAAWVGGGMVYGLGFACKGKSVPILEMLAAFAAVLTARVFFGKQTAFRVVGDSKYVIEAINCLQPVRSPELVLLWDLIVA